MCSSRSGVSLLVRCSPAAGLDASTAAAVCSGRWLNRTLEQDARERAASAFAAYSTPYMFDDLDRVMEPSWCDLWQDSNISTHPQNADWLENVTSGIMRSSSPYLLSKSVPDQMLTSALVPEIVVSSQTRSCDRKAKQFSCESNNSSVESEKAAVQFGNPSNTLDSKDSLSLEESYDSKNGGGNHDPSFLGYDWASMTDFDDLDGMLSGYSVQDDWAAGNIGEISTSTDSGCSRSSSHRGPENTIWEDSDENCSHSLHVQTGDECQGNARAESSKHSRFCSMEDGTNMDEEKGDHPSQLCSTSDWISDMEDNEMDCNLPAASSQQNSESTKNLRSDQQKRGQDDFAVPLLPSFHVAKKQRYNVPESYDSDHLCNLRNAFPAASSGEMLSAMPTMTPLQKIEKLRCNQQMQATHAINQQQKQFDQQFSGSVWNSPHMLKINQASESSDSEWRSDCEGTSRIAPPQEISTPVANEVNDISLLGLSEAESALSELQHIISKLDDNFITSIRDGLFRLASNAIEGSSEHDSGSTTCSRIDDEVTLAIGMMMNSMEA